MLTFIDLGLFRYRRGRLDFQVHWNKKLLLKHLNKEINHMKTTFIEIPRGVLNKLEKLTSRKEDNYKMLLN